MAIKNQDAKELETIFGNILYKISNRQHFTSESCYNTAIQIFIFALPIDIGFEERSEKVNSNLDIILSGNVYACIEVPYRALSTAKGKKSDKEKERLLSEICDERIWR
jgi:hypothetical protein